MAETDTPQLGMAAWADLAAVRRTIEWVGRDIERLERSRYTGKTVLRLLQRIRKRSDLSETHVDQLDQLQSILKDFDETDVAGKAERVERARTVLESVVSLGELGARRQDLEPKATLSKPSRRDRRSRRGESDESEGAAGDTDATVRADAGVESEASGSEDGAVETSEKVDQHVGETSDDTESVDVADVQESDVLGATCNRYNLAPRCPRIDRLPRRRSEPGPSTGLVALGVASRPFRATGCRDRRRR